MPVESWMTPEETAALAAQATSLIDTTLSRLTDGERAAFWASVRKCYNTPYNDPKPRALPRLQVDDASKAERTQAECSQVELSQAETPRIEAALAAMSLPAAFGAESHAP